MYIYIIYTYICVHIYIYIYMYIYSFGIWEIPYISFRPLHHLPQNFFSFGPWFDILVRYSFGIWEIPYRVIHTSTAPPSEFLLLWTLVRYTKVTEKSKFQALGSSGIQLFQSIKIGPLDYKMTVTLRKLRLPYVT